MTARTVEKRGTDRDQSKGADARRFEVTGGELCLDLANTVDCRPTDAPKERLCTYADLVAWGEQACAIDGRDARRLLASAQRRPIAAAAVLRRARALREALFAIFSSLAGGGQPETGDLAVLNGELKRALGYALLVTGDESGRSRATGARDAVPAYRWAWGDGSGEQLDRVLWPVARSAAELLTDDRLARVRECGAGNCAWLFLDTSRNRSRRWCDMKVCGNREKAHRHYRRKVRSR